MKRERERAACKQEKIQNVDSTHGDHKHLEIQGLEPVDNVVAHQEELSDFFDQCFPGRQKHLSAATINMDARRAKCRVCGQHVTRRKRFEHLLSAHLKKPVYKCVL
jgi:hypothetical protein